MTGNDDFLALDYTFEQGGQMGFGFKSTYRIKTKLAFGFKLHVELRVA